MRHKCSVLSVTLASVAAAVSLGAPAAAQAPSGATTPRSESGAFQNPSGSSSLAPSPRAFVPGEVIVRYRSGTPEQSQAGARRAVGSRLERNLPLVPGLEVVRLEPGNSVGAAVREFEARPDVLYAEPSYIQQLQALPNDSRFGDLWGLNNTGQAVDGISGSADADIDAPEAWNATTGTQSAPVAIIDSGIAYAHPDLAPNIFYNPSEIFGTAGVDDDANGYVDDFRGFDFVDNDKDIQDTEGHGTHVAGTVGARGNNDSPGPGTTDITGVDWSTRLMGLRVCGPGGCPMADQIEAFAYAQQMGAKVANLSFGGPVFSQAQSDAIAAASGVLFVAAAGNGGADGVGDNNDVTPEYPCAYSSPPNLVCVAATGQTDALTGFSNFGATSVDLAAPGENVLSAFPFRIPFRDNFETDLAGRWTTGGTPNTWGRTEEGYASPTHSLADSPNANYADNQNNFARTTNPINLSGSSSCVLKFLLLLGTETNLDFLHVEASTAAAGPWTTLQSFTATGQVAGATSLGPFTGQSGVFLRFRLTSNGSVNSFGAIIDDAKVQCTAPSQDSTSYDFLPGTSMAAPHATGVAALIKARFPNVTVEQLKARLLAAVDAKSGLAGKVVTGGRLNAYKAVAESSARAVGDALIYTAGAGVKNNVTITRFTDSSFETWYRIDDPFSSNGTTGSRIAPGANCVAESLTRVKCLAFGLTRILVFAGDQDDSVVVNSSEPLPLQVDGGPGADGLIGGAAGDSLTGGPGADSFFSFGGNDTINSRNDDVDSIFACGESASDTDTVTADSSPNDPVTAAPGNCEVVNKG